MNASCLKPKMYSPFSQTVCENFHFPLCNQEVILFLDWQKGGFACADIYFCSRNKNAKVVLKNSSVKNGYVSVNIHEKSTRNPSQTHASRESLTFFHWLTLVGFRVSDWNNLLLHQIKWNLSKQRAKSCLYLHFFPMLMDASLH